MEEKKTELKLAVGSVGAIFAIVMPAVVAALQALLEANAFSDGSAWYMIAVAIVAAGGALSISKVSGDYSRSRAVVKAGSQVANPTRARPSQPKQPSSE